MTVARWNRARSSSPGGGVTVWALRVLSVLVVIAVWEYFGRQRPVFASYPVAIAEAFVDLMFVKNAIVPAFATTLHGLFVGFVIAALAGTALGFLLGRIRILDLILGPYVSALYGAPRIALVPLLVLWFGIGFELRVTVVVLSAIFPIIVNAYAGAKNVGADYIDTADAFAATSWQQLKTVVLPASLPFAFAGLRIGIMRSLTGVIVAELTAALTGTGALLLAFGNVFATDSLFVLVILLGMLSIALAWLVQAAQRRAMPWATGDHG